MDKGVDELVNNTIEKNFTLKDPYGLDQQEYVVRQFFGLITNEEQFKKHFNVFNVRNDLTEIYKEARL